MVPTATRLSSSTVFSVYGDASGCDPSLYRKVIGSLQYLSLTRPDVAFTVNKLAQFMHLPSSSHWAALKRLLRYLKGTVDYGLFLPRSTTMPLRAFSDADWAGNPDDRTSTSAYLVYLGNCLVSWKSFKQKSVARSSTEAEYRALASAAAELAWIQSLLHEMLLPLSSSPPTLYCDNVGATYLSANPVFHSRMKDSAIDFHFVRERVKNGLLRVLHVSSADQLADALTKPLPKTRFLALRHKLCVSSGQNMNHKRTIKPITRIPVNVPIIQRGLSEPVVSAIYPASLHISSSGHAKDINSHREL